MAKRERSRSSAPLTLGLLSVRLGALPEADAAARISLGVLEGLGFDRGLRLLASVLVDIGIEAGQLDEAESVWIGCARPGSRQSSAR